MSYRDIPKRNLEAFGRCLEREATSLFGDNKYKVVIADDRGEVGVALTRNDKTVVWVVESRVLIGYNNPNIACLAIALAHELCAEFGVKYTN